MDNQELFDKVVLHLVKQGRPAGTSQGGSFSCRYMTLKGEQCAAGCLLPEDYDYTQIYYSTLDWEALVGLQPELMEIGSISFIRGLQKAHDRRAGDEAWRSEWFHAMNELAKRENLNNNVLNELATEEWRSVTAIY